MGLSPPTRGSRPGAGGLARRQGSIPAHTGKPGTSAPTRASRRVYPRPHGEAPKGKHSAKPVEGLSPPTRGSHIHGLPGRECDRSIPAHTGKPRARTSIRPCAWVYPRPHGEALVVDAHQPPRTGLSPPTRGSRPAARVRSVCPGSIPAHTGKPLRRSAPATSAWVYPRPHGEAAVVDSFIGSAPGLSPPTRGSRARHLRR